MIRSCFDLIACTRSTFGNGWFFSFILTRTSTGPRLWRVYYDVVDLVSTQCQAGSHSRRSQSRWVCLPRRIKWPWGTSSLKKGSLWKYHAFVSKQVGLLCTEHCLYYYSRMKNNPLWAELDPNQTETDIASGWLKPTDKFHARLQESGCMYAYVLHTWEGCMHGYVLHAWERDGPTLSPPQIMRINLFARTQKNLLHWKLYLKC